MSGTCRVTLSLSRLKLSQRECLLLIEAARAISLFLRQVETDTGSINFAYCGSALGFKPCVLDRHLSILRLHLCRRRPHLRLLSRSRRLLHEGNSLSFSHTLPDAR